MKKKGFTLVELLAVIIILGLLVILVLPNVMKLFNDAKQRSFTNELKHIYSQARQQWVTDSVETSGEKIYVRTSSDTCEKSLDLTGRSELEYYIRLNRKGKVVEFFAQDGTYQYHYNGEDLKISDIENVVQISKIANGEYMSITCDGAVVIVPPPANSDDYLMAGDSNSNTYNYLRTTIAKKDIETITFTNSLSGHTPNGSDCWDVSVGETGSILAWSTDSDNEI